MRTDSPRTSETIPMHGDPMTDPTRDALREAAQAVVTEYDRTSPWRKTMVHERIADLRSALATPDPAPDVEAAWEALYDDVLATSDAPMTDFEGVIVRHRPIIEAAIRAQGATPDPAPDSFAINLTPQQAWRGGYAAGRKSAQGGGLDVETLARADWEVFGGARASGSTWDDLDDSAKQNTLSYAHKVAAEYARLRDTPSPQKENQ